MAKYIALLRGINVSGQKKIKMADLRDALNKEGFKEVQTYIQSGNIVLESKKVANSAIEKRIEKLVKSSFGFDVPILVRTPEELKKALEQNPFDKEFEDHPKRLYLTFLSQEPEKKLVDLLSQTDYSPEKFEIVGDKVYFFSPEGYGRAKMNNNFFEKKLKVNATTRNWKTCQTLLEMAGI